MNKPHAASDMTNLRSMTAFAASSGQTGPYRWTCELRSVNGKGLDLRVRAPDWVDGLEAALRAVVAPAVTRGNVTLNVRVTRDDTTGSVQVNEGQLAAVLTALTTIEAAAMDRGVSLQPSTATDIAGLRGVLEQSAGDQDTVPLRAALVADMGGVVDSFARMRAGEGAALDTSLRAQLDAVAQLTAQAAEQADARKDAAAETLKRNLARVLDTAAGVDANRLAQELALIAVKADITEEIDRLQAHIAAARDLLDDGGTVGRKLDFLMQEFNREANTLCAKAQSTELTQTGLALKALIDQMREQVQNVE